MNLSELGTLVAVIAGIYGILQSTYLIVREIIKERRKVVVVCEETMEEWPDLTIVDPRFVALQQLSPKYNAITIRVINKGSQPIFIASLGFYLSNGEVLEERRDSKHINRIDKGESAGFPFGIVSLQKSLADKSYPKNIALRLLDRFFELVDSKKWLLWLIIISLLPLILIRRLFRRSRFWNHHLRLVSPVYVKNNAYSTTTEHKEIRDTHYLDEVDEVREGLKGEQAVMERLENQLLGVKIRLAEKTIHFRWPIVLEEGDRLGKFIYEDDNDNDNTRAKVYLKAAFIRDVEENEYRISVPKFLEKYQLKKPRWFNSSSRN